MLGGVKSAIGLIFKMISFKAKALKISIHVNWPILRHFWKIAEIQKPTTLVPGGVKVQ